eukprot:14736772-Ditylum_brightwellii.AAC.1
MKDVWEEKRGVEGVWVGEKDGVALFMRHRTDWEMIQVRKKATAAGSWDCELIVRVLFVFVLDM